MSKHFLFDLGNVLVNFDVQQLYRAVAEESGRPVEEISISLQDGEMLRVVETGKITDQQFADCFFMDDKEENVEAARAVGMNGRLFSAKNLPLVRSAIEIFVAE